jgi:hypothetical protein
MGTRFFRYCGNFRTIKGNRSMELCPLPNRTVEDWSTVYRKSLYENGVI